MKLLSRAPRRSTLAALGLLALLPALVLAQSSQQQVGGRAAAPPAQPTPPTTYTYDAVGRLTRVVYPDGTTLDYAYDSRSNLTGMVVVP